MGLRGNLIEVFNLPMPVVDWLIMIFDIIQVFDDVADGDPVKRDDLNATIWNSLVGMHQNQFFMSNSNNLVPLLASMVLKWQGSDTSERLGRADEKSFMWRAGYYDLVLMAVSIVHGAEYATKNSHLVMALYGENLIDYLEEFKNA